ncbi:hypothetical protein IEQ34_018156 [Dendrobium chrysotoxum]|uniref:Uncharacterized protein n=1 Tax=Dendrobium chrysotoxum TaxID=161865 RepID=A0AAV7GDF8_DENCH|nr:hypothetical protein IEQ34_018156 [Dendrobium chrysotoxum]
MLSNGEKGMLCAQFCDFSNLPLPPIVSTTERVLGMGFLRKEYQFLSEIGLGPRNPGCYLNGSWRGSGPLVASLNPANNEA